MFGDFGFASFWVLNVSGHLGNSGFRLWVLDCVPVDSLGGCRLAWAWVDLLDLG